MRIWTVALAGLMTGGPRRMPPSTPAEQSGSGASGVPPDQEAAGRPERDSPIQYPPACTTKRSRADVILRLFVDSTGRLLPNRAGSPTERAIPRSIRRPSWAARKLRFAPAGGRPGDCHGVPPAGRISHPASERRRLKGERTPPRPTDSVRAPRLHLPRPFPCAQCGATRRRRDRTRSPPPGYDSRGPGQRGETGFECRPR